MSVIGPVLGIETSCDETSAAVVEGGRIRSLSIASQDAHAAFGGVVPEIAARAHLTRIEPIVAHALDQAGLDAGDIRGVGVTAGPGLVGALLVGVNWAKAFALGRDIPLLGIHHMEGHLFATVLEDEDAVPPFVGLLVSGGHTLLVEALAWGRYRLLGSTRDDAAGEAFDKVARRIGLGYPGGPQIQRAAERGRPGVFSLPRPMLASTDRPGDPAYYDMSFSGLKTAVSLTAAELEERGELEEAVPDLAAEFQAAVIDVLVEKVMRAVSELDASTVVLGGGVARNGPLRERLEERLVPGRRLFAPSPRLATDNAAMIAAVAEHRFAAGERDDWSLNADPALPFPGLVAARVDARRTAAV